MQGRSPSSNLSSQAKIIDLDMQNACKDAAEKAGSLPVPPFLQSHALESLPRMTKSFDVFLSHNSKDKPAVRELAEALRARGLKVWLDEWELVPGRLWQEALEEVIETTKSSVVLVGKDDLGPWHAAEMRGCLTEFVRRKLPVIPVLLPGAPTEPRLPLFLKQVTWVDLRSGFTEEGLDHIYWGITGKRPDRSSPPASLPPTSEVVHANKGASAEAPAKPNEGETSTAVAQAGTAQKMPMAGEDVSPELAEDWKAMKWLTLGVLGLLPFIVIFILWALVSKNGQYEEAEPEELPTEMATTVPLGTELTPSEPMDTELGHEPLSTDMPKEFRYVPWREWRAKTPFKFTPSISPQRPSPVWREIKGTLSNREKRRHVLSLQEGYVYLFVGTGDEHCTDLFIALEKDSIFPFSVAESNKYYACVSKFTFSPPKKDSFRVYVYMKGCTVNPCSYFVEVKRRPV